MGTLHTEMMDRLLRVTATVLMVAMGHRRLAMEILPMEVMVPRLLDMVIRCMVQVGRVVQSMVTRSFAIDSKL